MSVAALTCMPGEGGADPQLHRSRCAVGVFASRIDRMPTGADPAHFLEEAPVGRGRVGRPGIEDDGRRLPAALIGSGRPTGEPGFRLRRTGQRPAGKTDDHAALEDEEIVVPVDLTGEHARPVAETQPGEGRFGHEIAHRYAERGVAVPESVHREFPLSGHWSYAPETPLRWRLVRNQDRRQRL